METGFETAIIFRELSGRHILINFHNEIVEVIVGPVSPAGYVKLFPLGEWFIPKKIKVVEILEKKNE